MSVEALAVLYPSYECKNCLVTLGLPIPKGLERQIAEALRYNDRAHWRGGIKTLELA